jgi:ABC-type amino acid transport substrate-binding protein
MQHRHRDPEATSLLAGAPSAPIGAGSPATMGGDGAHGRLARWFGLQACGASLSRAFDDLGRSQRDLIEQIDAIEGATHAVPDMLVNARTALERGGRLPAIAQGDVRALADAALPAASAAGSGAPLAGLDVDWARAFADLLGVPLSVVERPWVECPSALLVGEPGPDREPPEPDADLMWSALLPAASYHGLAFSQPYHRLHVMLVRRRGDTSIRDHGSLHGRTLGCINDPTAFDVRREEGLAWGRQPGRPSGRPTGEPDRLRPLRHLPGPGRGAHGCLSAGPAAGRLAEPQPRQSLVRAAGGAAHAYHSHRLALRGRHAGRPRVGVVARGRRPVHRLVARLTCASRRPAAMVGRGCRGFRDLP